MQTRDASATTLKVGKQLRFATVERAKDAAADSAIVGEDRRLTLSFSSELPVERWFGDEVLSHQKSAADFSRLNDGAPLLWGHNWDRQIGVVEKAWIEGSRGMATVRFARTADGDEFVAMVNDGIVRNVSFAYQVNNYRAEGDGEPGGGADPVYTATSWLAYEISLVSVPADASVGVNRTENVDAQSVPVQRSTPTTATAVHIERIDMESNTAAPDQAVLQQTRDEALKNERQRTADIEALCQKHKVDDAVRTGMITGGATIAEARGTVLDIVSKRTSSPIADLGGSPNPDLTDAEKSKYSMLRAVNAALSKDWTKAGFEREVSIAIAKKSQRDEGTLGFYLPTNIPFYVDARTMPRELRAQYATSAAATGGVLVGTSLLAGSFIEILRNQARVMQLGATVLSGLVGNIDIPRQAGTATAYWVGEGASPTESEATFEKLGLTPRTLGVYSMLTRNMLLQATPDVEQLARNDLLKVIALALDAACLYGTGAGGQPMGIANTTGIGSVVGGTNGAQFTIDHFIDLETQVTQANVMEDSLAYLANAKTVGWIKKTKSTTGQYLWTNIPNGQRSGTPGELNGYPVARSNQARSTLVKGSSGAVCSELYFGNWSELIVGEWGVIEVLPNPYGANYKNGGIELRALQTVDVGLRHPASFAVMSDGLTV